MSPLQVERLTKFFFKIINELLFEFGDDSFQNISTYYRFIGGRKTKMKLKVIKKYSDKCCFWGK